MKDETQSQAVNIHLRLESLALYFHKGCACAKQHNIVMFQYCAEHVEILHRIRSPINLTLSNPTAHSSYGNCTSTRSLAQVLTYILALFHRLGCIV